MTCIQCNQPYDPAAPPPADNTDYASGVGRYCRSCWLGVGPRDIELMKQEQELERGETP
ncbi:MAG: hypothetical protein L6Q84_35440 [Polyangiaceae bacterium]|nr:hypothetical protein [Polyangiaceae bacterium]